MAHNLNNLEPSRTRWNPPSEDYPLGSFIDGSAQGKRNGSFCKAAWANDIFGFFGALFRNAGLKPNGIVETARNSQLFTALIMVIEKATQNKIDELDFEAAAKELIDEFDNEE
jgi:hypothetical protein|nr:MAG TPA: hypothetical protein [Caudoviricetes sp.]